MELAEHGEVVVAAADLVGRSGAKGFEIGYHEDHPEPGSLNWYAEAVYKGAKLTGEGPGPGEAAEALARSILHGARCRRCGKPVQLRGNPRRTTVCTWSRDGERWVPGCGQPIDGSIPLEPHQVGH